LFSYSHQTRLKGSVVFLGSHLAEQCFSGNSSLLRQVSSPVASRKNRSALVIRPWSPRKRPKTPASAAIALTKNMHDSIGDYPRPHPPCGRRSQGSRNAIWRHHGSNHLLDRTCNPSIVHLWQIQAGGGCRIDTVTPPVSQASPHAQATPQQS
jgi:hypothetical protein